MSNNLKDLLIGIFLVALFVGGVFVIAITAQVKEQVKPAFDVNYEN